MRRPRTKLVHSPSHVDRLEGRSQTHMDARRMVRATPSLLALEHRLPRRAHRPSATRHARSPLWSHWHTLIYGARAQTR